MLIAVGLLGRPAAAQPADTLLARGLLAYGGGHYQDALELFRQAVRDDRKNAEAHYQMARTYLELQPVDGRRAREAVEHALELEPDEVRYLELKARVYREAPGHAAFMEQMATRKHLARAILEQDPEHAEALVEMGRVTLDDYEWNFFGTGRFRNEGFFRRKAQRAYEEVESYLLRAIAADPAAPEAYRLLMKLYAHAEDYEKALDVLETMHLHRPDDPFTWLFRGLAYHNLSNAPQAAHSFEQALLRMEPGLLAEFTDLTRVLNDEQIVAYRQDPEGFARAFWARRDARLLTLDNERLNEHYARMVYADLFFASGRGGRGWETERGDTFVRYGKPNNLPYITSRYGDPQVDGYVSKERIVTWVYDGFSLQFEDWVRNGEYIFFDEDEVEARVLRRDVTERYDHEEPGRRVAFPFLASAFKGEAGRTDLYVPYGLPLGDVDPEVPFIRMTLATGAFLIDPAGQITSERRTEHGLETAQVAFFTDTPLWIGVHHLRAAPGAQELAVEFETQDRTAVGYQREMLEIPDFSADSLMLSDILPAYGIEEAGGTAGPGNIVRDGHSIRPAPWGVFSTQQPLYLYFEVYNLVPDAGGATSYDVEAVLAPWDDAGTLKRFLRGVFGRERAEGVSLGFTIDGRTRDDAQYMIMDVRDQAPGRYVLAIRVVDGATGQAVEMSREVHLE